MRRGERARQDRDDVPQVDLLRDAPLRHDDVRVEVDAQLLARAAHLFEDPVARGADAARCRFLIGEGVAGAEADQPGEQFFQSLFRDRRDDLLDLWIGVRTRCCLRVRQMRRRDDQSRHQQFSNDHRRVLFFLAFEFTNRHDIDSKSRIASGWIFFKRTSTQA